MLFPDIKISKLNVLSFEIPKFVAKSDRSIKFIANMHSYHHIFCLIDMVTILDENVIKDHFRTNGITRILTG